MEERGRRRGCLRQRTLRRRDGQSEAALSLTGCSRGSHSSAPLRLHLRHRTFHPASALAVSGSDGLVFNSRQHCNGSALVDAMSLTLRMLADDWRLQRAADPTSTILHFQESLVQPLLSVNASLSPSLSYLSTTNSPSASDSRSASPSSVSSASSSASSAWPGQRRSSSTGCVNIGSLLARYDKALRLRYTPQPASRAAIVTLSSSSGKADCRQPTPSASTACTRRAPAGSGRAHVAAVSSTQCEEKQQLDWREEQPAPPVLRPQRTPATTGTSRPQRRPEAAEGRREAAVSIVRTVEKTAPVTGKDATFTAALDASQAVKERRKTAAVREAEQQEKRGQTALFASRRRSVEEEEEATRAKEEEEVAWAARFILEYQKKERQRKLKAELRRQQQQTHDAASATDSRTVPDRRAGEETTEATTAAVVADASFASPLSVPHRRSQTATAIRPAATTAAGHRRSESASIGGSSSAVSGRPMSSAGALSLPSPTARFVALSMSSPSPLPPPAAAELARPKLSTAADLRDSLDLSTLGLQQSEVSAHRDEDAMTASARSSCSTADPSPRPVKSCLRQFSADSGPSRLVSGSRRVRWVDWSVH